MSRCINIHDPFVSSLVKEYGITSKDLHAIFTADDFEGNTRLSDEEIKNRIANSSKYTVALDNANIYRKSIDKYTDYKSKLEERGVDTSSGLIILPDTAHNREHISENFGVEYIGEAEINGVKKLVLKRPTVDSEFTTLDAEKKADLVAKLIQTNSKRIKGIIRGQMKQLAGNTVSNRAGKMTREEDKNTNSNIYMKVGAAIGNIVEEAIVRELHGVNCTEAPIKNCSPEFANNLHLFSEKIKEELNKRFPKGYKVVTSDLTLRANLKTVDSNNEDLTESLEGEMDVLIYDNEGNFYVLDIKNMAFNSTSPEAQESYRNREIKYQRQVYIYSEMIKSQYGEYVNSVTPLGLIGVGLQYTFVEEGSIMSRQKDGTITIDGNSLESLTKTITVLTEGSFDIGLIIHDTSKIDVSDLKEFSEYDHHELNLLQEEFITTTPIFSPKISLAQPSTTSLFYESAPMSKQELTDIANSAMATASLYITWMQQDPTFANELFGNVLQGLDTTTMSREELIRAVGGMDAILNAVKEDYFNTGRNGSAKGVAIEDVTDPEVLRKKDFIYDNWAEFCELGKSRLQKLENLNRIVDEEISFEEELTRENHEDNHKESYQESNYNKSSRSSLSTSLRRILSRLPETSQGEYALDSWGHGMYKFVNENEAINKMLEWCYFCSDSDQMMKVLESKTGVAPWVSDVLNLLRDPNDPVSVTDPQLKSQLFQFLKKNRIRYGIVTVKADENGRIHPVVSIINDSSKEDFLLETLASNLYRGNVKFFEQNKEEFELQGTVNKKAVEELHSKIESLENAYKDYKNNRNLPAEQVNAYVETFQKELGSLLSYMGLEVDNEVIFKYSQTINFINGKSKVDTIIKQANDIYRNFNAAVDAESYSPLSFIDNKEVRNQWGVKNKYKNIIKELADFIPDVVESSTYENGKMYYSFVSPSQLSIIIEDLKNTAELTPEEYRSMLDEEYGFSEFFKKEDGKYRSSWLDLLANKNDVYKEILEFKTQLHYNKVPYKELSKIGYAQSMLTEFFFSQKVDDIVTGYYRVPVLSNKPAAEFIRFIRYVGDNFKSTIAKNLEETAIQEILRIRTVIERAAKHNNDSKLEHYDLDRSKIDSKVLDKIDRGKELTSSDFSKLSNGAEFKFLPFLNEVLRDKESELGELLREYINNGKLSEFTDFSRQLRSKITEYLNKAVEEEIEYYESIGMFEWEEYGNDIKFKYFDNILSKSHAEHLRDAIKTTLNENRFKSLRDSLLKDNKVQLSAYSNLKSGSNKIFIDAVKKKMLETMREDINSQLENYVWNDYLASANIIQLTLGDLAFVKNTEDLQKRFAQYHSPGLRLDIAAQFENEKGELIKFSADGLNRTVTIEDDIHTSNIIENIKYVFNKEIARNPELKDILEEIRDNAAKALEDFNSTDGQAFVGLTAAIKKLGMAGRMSDSIKEAFEVIRNRKPGEKIDASALNIAIQPSKPLNSSYNKKASLSAGDNTVSTIKVPLQHKNSEYTLVLAEAIMAGSESNNLLSALYEVMEESAYDRDNKDLDYNDEKNTHTYNGKGIDAILFKSNSKVGAPQKAIDLSNMSKEEAKDYLRSKIYRGSKVDSSNYNDSYVVASPFKGYMIQQEVPAHFKDHAQLAGSQSRILNVSDVDAEASFRVYNEETREYEEKKGKDVVSEYKNKVAENIKKSYNKLIKDFKLENATEMEREEALSNILKEAIRKDGRYGYDLYLAVSLDSNGRLNIPISDPVQSVRIQQLLNSIIKSRINKQYVKGGPIVQTTSHGLSEDLSMVWTDRSGNKLLTFSEWSNKNGKNSKEEYQRYLNSKGAQFAYFEAYVPCFSEQLEELLTKEDGTMMSIEEAIDKGYMTEEQRKAIGYRIPTEDKYSMMPIYIKGFLPRQGGEAIMLPKEITVLTGADFDIDKMYTIIKDYNVEIKGGSENIKAKSRGFIYNFIKEKFNDFYEESGLSLELKDSFFNGQIANNPKSFSSLVYDSITSGNTKLFEQQLEKMDEASNSYKQLLNLQTLVDSFVEKYKIHLIDRKKSQIEVSITPPKQGSRRANNNDIFNLQWSILTTNDTLTKLFNPQSVDEIRDVASIIRESKGLTKESTNMLLTSTQIKFHNQNMVAGSLIGVFANHNVSHAFVQAQDIKIKFAEGNSFTINGVTVDNEFNNSISNIRGYDGVLISKRIASFLAASVDAVKDPLLNYLNLNTATANVAMLLARLGFDTKTIGLFLSQPILEELCDEYYKLSNEGYVAMGDLIKIIMKEKGYVDATYSNVDFTHESLIKGLKGDKSMEGAVLALFNMLSSYAQHLNTLTFMTKFNSVKNSAGPSIADTLVLEARVKKFYELMEDEDSAPFNSNAQHVVDNDPILSAFYEHTIGEDGAVNKLMKPYFPHYSKNFRELLGDIIVNSKSPLDAKIINIIVSDWAYFGLTKSVIDSSQDTRTYYAHQFPSEVSRVRRMNSGHPLFNNISDVEGGRGKPIRTIETRTGNFDTAYQEEYKSIWTDALDDSNPEIAKIAREKIFYMLSKNGFWFSPRGDAHLLSTTAKRRIEGYVDALRNPEELVEHDMISVFKEQLYRNRCYMYKLVPKVKFNKKVKVSVSGNILTITGDPILTSSIITNRSDESITACPYIRYGKNLYALKKIEGVDELRFTYTQVEMLGVPNNFVEYDYNDPDIKSVIGTKVDISEHEEDIPMSAIEDVNLDATIPTNLESESPNATLALVNKALGLSGLKDINKNSILEPISLDDFNDGSNDDFQDESFIKEVEDIVKNGVKLKGRKLLDVHESIIKYNDSSKTNKLALVQEDGSVRLVDNNYPNSLLALELKAKLASSKVALETILRAGYQVAFGKMTEAVNGMFDPQNAEETMDELITVIKVSNSLLGMEAISEEFAHLMVEGLQHREHVKRLLNIIRNDDNLMKSILGEEYDLYNELYKGDHELLCKEAAGKLLHAHLLGNKGYNTYLHNILSRIAKTSLKGFEGMTEQQVRDQINEDLDKLAKEVSSDNVIDLIDDDFIENIKNCLDILYQTLQSLNDAHKLLEKAVAAKGRRMKALLREKKGNRYSKRDSKTIRFLLDSLNKKAYANGMMSFLNNVLYEASSIISEALKLTNIRSLKDLVAINKCATSLNSMKKFVDGYKEIVDDLKILSEMVESGLFDGLTQEDADLISEQAKEVSRLVGAVHGLYRNSRLNAAYAFLKPYWSSPEILVGENKGKKLELLDALQVGDRDLNVFDRLFSSLSDANDPLLSTFDKAVKLAMARRDRVLRDIIPAIRNSYLELRALGYTTDFMFERDENGNLTGRYISNIDYDAYYKARKEFIAKLREEGYEGRAFRDRLTAWEKNNCEEVLVDPSYSEEGRYETRPKEEVYGKKVKIESQLSNAQLDYYNAVMRLKALLDSLLPSGYATQHKAVQMRSDITETLLESGHGPIKGIKSIFKLFKESIIKNELDEAEFGETEELVTLEENELFLTEETDLESTIAELENDSETSSEESEEGKKKKIKVKHISLDASGKRPLKKVPVFYTRRLSDMSRLTTDLTGSLLSYASMAINYSEMNKIVDALEIVKDLISSRHIQQHSGDSVVAEVFKIFGNTFIDKYTVKGEGIIKRLEDYFDSVIYGQHKKLEMEFAIKGKRISGAKALDALKDYSGKLGLGLNAFSALSNITIGKTQMFIEGIGGEYFGYKDMLWAKKEYYYLLGGYIAEINAVNPTNKLKLLMDRFDVLDNYYLDLLSEKVRKNVVNRLIGNTSLMFLNNAGEHYLRNRVMLAMLNSHKVYHKDTHEEVSLYEALIEEEIKSKDGKVIGKKIVANPDYQVKTTIDGLDIYENLSEDYLDSFRLRISKVNGSLNGLFGEIDKGAIHRHALGRIAMLFRQWMPGHYYRRFASIYYDAALELYREGYYRTSVRFLVDCLKGHKGFIKNAILNWENLNAHEIANIKRASTEMIIFVILCILCSGFLGLMDDLKDGVWAERVAAYTLLRMRMEVGASTPIPHVALNNILTTLKSPAAAIGAADALGKLLGVHHLFEPTIKSGRWEGWNPYFKNVVTGIPGADKMIKLLDLSSSEGKKMFSIYEKNF